MNVLVIAIALLVARVLQEQLAEQQGIDMEEYGDELAYQITGLKSARQIQQDADGS